MNKSFTLIGTALFAGMGLVASNALAADYTWTAGGNGDWSDDANWSGTGVPDDVGDSATIDPASALVVTMDGNYTVGKLVVGEKATLNITANNELILDGTGSQNGQLIIQATSESVFGKLNVRDQGTFTFVDPDANVEHEIGGNIVLQADESLMQITDDDATFSPYFDGSSNWFGNVVGQHNDAQLAIESGFKLKIDITVKGQMKVEDFGGAGNPTFELLSNGEALANVAGTLRFGVGVDLDDASSSLWGAEDSASAVLEFNHSATVLAGDFILDDDATIQLDVEGILITTSGALIDSGGGANPDGCIDADAVAGSESTTFTYSGGSVSDAVTCFP